MNLSNVNLICGIKECVTWTQHIKNGLKKSKKKWVLCYDSGHQYDNMATNLSESFNYVLKKYFCNAYFYSSTINILQM